MQLSFAFNKKFPLTEIVFSCEQISLHARVAKNVREITCEVIECLNEDKGLQLTPHSVTHV